MAAILVTILVNNFNYGRFLGQAIDSALAQTYPHCEIVVVDDGSTDESRKVIANYGTRIRPVLKENGGQGSAFNAGVAHAQGDIVMFLDSDDYLAPEAAERIVSVWNEDTQIVHHRLKIVDASGRDRGFWPDKDQPLSSGNVVPTLLSTGLYGAPPSSGLAYGRRLLERLLPMPEEEFRLCADAWLFLQGPFFSPVTAIDESLAFYRLHGSNNWGPEWPTRLMSAGRLAAFITTRSRGHDLIATQAALQNLGFNRLDWENAFTLRWKLILMRKGLWPSSELERSQMVRTILQKVRRSNFNPARKLREALLTLLIWKAPNPVLHPIFPNIF